MSNRKKALWWSLGILVLGSGVATALAVFLMYTTAIDEERKGLLREAKVEADLVTVLARVAPVTSGGLSPGTSGVRLQIPALPQHSTMTGRERFSVAVRQEAELVYVLPPSEAPTGQFLRVPVTASGAAPMVRALAVESGTTFGRDAYGQPVLTAYTPAAGGQFGVVVTTPLAELRAPFLRTGLYAGGAMFLVVLAGSLLLLRTVSPLLRRLEDTEATFRMVANFTLAWEYWVGPKGDIRYVSPSCQGMTGRSMAEFLADPTLLTQIAHPADRSRIATHVQEEAEGRAAGSLEFRILTPTGQARWISHTCQPVVDQDGGGLGTRASNLDVTDAKRTSEQLEVYAWELGEANEELRRSNKELDDFAYVASHDLREPLRGIRNYAAFVVEDYGERLDAEGRAKLETLMRLTQRMDALIESLLYYSRIGRKDLVRQETDMNGLVAEVLDSLADPLQRSDAHVSVSPLPPVACDPGLVREIFHNLITNALKYNDKPEKRLEIGVLQEGERGSVAGLATFSVRDNGIGIPDKHRETIFRIFKRLHGREEYGGGTGVGLTIARKIVERHGGRIWAESQPGEGATFLFTLGNGGDA
jgi:PAS domain S-box-containing protein